MGVFPFFFCRPLTLGECYTGQPACSIRPANHALAYICLYPFSPLPFRKAPLRVAVIRLNHRLLRFWAAFHSTTSLLTACLIHHPCLCIFIVCADTIFSPRYRPYRKKTDSILNVPWTLENSQHVTTA